MTDFEIAATPETRCAANGWEYLCYQRIAKVEEEGWMAGGDLQCANDADTALAMAAGGILGVVLVEKKSGDDVFLRSEIGRKNPSRLGLVMYCDYD